MNTDKKTVLMVDDSTINLEMMSVMIGDVYNLKFATDGQKALSLLKNEDDISLVLLDLSMPYMSGTEFLAEAKKESEGNVCYINENGKYIAKLNSELYEVKK